MTSDVIQVHLTVFDVLPTERSIIPLKSVSSRLSAGSIPQSQHLGVEYRRVARSQARAPLLLPPERVVLHRERDAGAQEVRQRARSPVLADGTRGALQREAAARDGASTLRKWALS